MRQTYFTAEPHSTSHLKIFLALDGRLDISVGNLRDTGDSGLQMVGQQAQQQPFEQESTTTLYSIDGSSVDHWRKRWAEVEVCVHSLSPPRKFVHYGQCVILRPHTHVTANQQYV